MRNPDAFILGKQDPKAPPYHHDGRDDAPFAQLGHSPGDLVSGQTGHLADRCGRPHVEHAILVHAAAKRSHDRPAVAADALCDER